MVSMTAPGWCPPSDSGPLFRWTITFEPIGESDEWLVQSVLLGGPPAGVDLERLLREWFARRGGRDARWRMRVTRHEDESVVLAEVTLYLSGWVAGSKSLGSTARTSRALRAGPL